MDHAPRFCFLTERQVGIGSAAGAIERYLRDRPNVVWKDITYFEPGGLIERLLPKNRVSGTLRGFLQSGEALGRGPFDALFFLTHNPAVLRQQRVGETPTALWTDVTPALLDGQAEQYDHPVDESKRIQALKRALVRRTFERAALCIGWSDWARRSFEEDYGVPREKTRVVPPGIDLSHWRPAPRDTDEPHPRLLFVGGNLIRKGGDLLLDVFRRHFRGRCTLDIVTRDPLDPEEGVRVHHGLSATSPALLELYQRASALVLPTTGDCFSIASIEAMAMGLPVVVSAVGGIPEIVEHGESGFLIPPRDGAALREALDALLADGARRQRMGTRSRMIVEERFDAKRTADVIWELLTSIAARPGAAKERRAQT